MKKPKTQKKVLHVCIDRRMDNDDPVPRMMSAIKSNPSLNPTTRGTAEHTLLKDFLKNPQKKFSLTERASIKRMAILTSTKWVPGQTITVAFLDGSKLQREKTKKYARYWTDKKMGNANLKFRFVSGKKGMIRISFIADDGSWSWLGTECKDRPVHEPTMNFGWLRNDSPDKEWERVVVHEFGHALGCIHEHQNPTGGIKWNKPVVYKYYKGAPNNWTTDEVDDNIFNHYNKNITQFTQMDNSSIMAYFIPPEFTLNGFKMPENSKLSPTDIAFIRAQYPH